MNFHTLAIQEDCDLVRQRLAQQTRHQRILAQRVMRSRLPMILLLALGILASLIIGRIAFTSPLLVVLGIIACAVCIITLRHAGIALVVLTILTTEFIPKALSLKSMTIYPIILLTPLIIVYMLIQLAFRKRTYIWPSLAVTWPMIALIVLGIISNLAIQVVWTPGVPHTVSNNPLIFSEGVAIYLYALPVLVVMLTVALMTNAGHWLGRIMLLFRLLSVLSALFVLVDFARLHGNIYSFRFEEPSILWIRLPAVAMMLGVGAILSFTYLLYAHRWRERLLFAAETIIALIALGITLQNTWWLEAIVGIIVVSLIYSWRLFLLECVGGISLLFFLKGALNKLQSVKADDTNRLIIWQDMLRVWKLHPLLGLGPGNVWTYDQEYTHLPLLLRNFATTGLGVAHNGYLQVLVEMGPLGLLLFLAVLFTIGLASWRLFKRSHPQSERLDRILALASLGLLVGSMVGDFTSGAFFYLNGQIGGFNSLPSLLTNWMFFGLVFYKDQLWRRSWKTRGI
jgi:O-antigen ligase